jgi:hypothetical protein
MRHGTLRRKRKGKLIVPAKFREHGEELRLNSVIGLFHAGIIAFSTAPAPVATSFGVSPIFSESAEPLRPPARI